MGDSGWNVLLSPTWKTNLNTEYFLILVKWKEQVILITSHFCLAGLHKGLGWLPTCPTWENLIWNLGSFHTSFYNFLFFLKSDCVLLQFWCSAGWCVCINWISGAVKNGTTVHVTYHCGVALLWYIYTHLYYLCLF